MAQIFTHDEVTRHNKEKDLWMIIHEGVYDLTKFLKEHPGGEEVLINLAGKDGTTCFDEIGHTTEAVQLRETLKIGKVTGGSGGEAPSGGGPLSRDDLMKELDDDWEYEEKKAESSPWIPVFVGIGVLVYAVIFYTFWR
ncbi:cytochrome b5-like [Cephus cinctus]|uniref:Cytochrome b5-like n=1 Tax=Cephus cinctus TaxID=211228 RepID=A0AAJ7BLE2_CEPCN|nr:cytochrome b5-like [Cephus cinctus]